MIQSTPIKAYTNRSDKVFWAIQSQIDIQSTSGITRCVFVFKKDDQADVIVDSNIFPSAFSLAEVITLHGKLVNGLSWFPSIVLDSATFSTIGIWKADVYLYDSIHVDGLFYGQFEIDLFDLPPSAPLDWSPVSSGVSVSLLGSYYSSTTSYIFGNTGTIRSRTSFTLGDAFTSYNAPSSANIVGFIGDETNVIAATSSGLYTSNNNGSSYNLVAGSAGIVFNGLASVTTSAGGLEIAFGNSGIIYATNAINGSWSSGTHGINHLNAAASGGNGVAVVVGNGGALFTATVPATFTSRSSGTSNDLLSVAVVANSRYVACGKNGAVVTAGIGGTSWSLVSISGVSGYNFRSIANNGFRWVIVGDDGAGNGVVLTTTTPQTAGSWVITSFTGKPFKAVGYLSGGGNPSRFIIVGDGGSAIELDSSGATFTTTTTGTSENIRMLGADPYGALAVGNNGTLIYRNA